MKKALQILVSIVIFVLLWKLLKLYIFNMETVNKCAATPAIFWTFWAIEAAFMLWWLGSDLKLPRRSVNPFVWVFWLYLLIACVLYIKDLRVIAMIMTGIGALPLAIMALFAITMLISRIFDGPSRWN